MKEGWNAEGLLKPLWIKYGGRDKLAEDAKVSRSTLASANSGKRNLGPDAGERIAKALGVSVLELGAPETLADERGVPLIARLVEVRSEVAELTTDVRRLTRRVVALERRAPPALEGPPDAAPQAQ